MRNGKSATETTNVLFIKLVWDLQTTSRILDNKTKITVKKKTWRLAGITYEIWPLQQKQCSASTLDKYWFDKLTGINNGTDIKWLEPLRELKENLCK